jgi:dienelactone hydrolase
MMQVGLRTSVLVWALRATAQVAATQESASPESVPDQVTIAVPGAGIFGGEASMRTLVFKPQRPGPYPIVLFAHGRAADAFDRAKLKNPVAAGHVRYWLAKGYAVVAPVRPGYGDSGGSDGEETGVHYNNFGVCTAQPDYGAATTAAVRAMARALNWVRAQDWARADQILLEGQSAGGLATLALCASSPPGVVGCINFAGGAGGSPVRSPGRMCAAEKIDELMRDFGARTRVPNIWLYAENDLFWGAELPRQWHATYAVGGSPTEFVGTPPLPNADGHQLLLHGGRMWSVPLDAWLGKQGF